MTLIFSFNYVQASSIAILSYLSRHDQTCVIPIFGEATANCGELTPIEIFGATELDPLSVYLTYGLIGIDAFNNVWWLSDKDREILRKLFWRSTGIEARNSFQFPEHFDNGYATHFLGKTPVVNCFTTIKYKYYFSTIVSRRSQSFVSLTYQSTVQPVSVAQKRGFMRKFKHLDPLNESRGFLFLGWWWTIHNSTKIGREWTSSGAWS